MNMIKSSAPLKFLFWMVFGVGCLLTLTYLASIILAGFVIADNVNLSSLILLLPGLMAMAAQGYALKKAITLYHIDSTPPARLFLIVFGSSVLIAFIWFGGCMASFPLSGIRIAG
ncbi:hypothetical protein ACFL2V_03465 [Pseudomonadota bacterium]